MAGFKKNKRGEKKKDTWPACERRHWDRDMVMKSNGVGRIAYDSEVYLTEQLKWVSTTNPDRVRVPQEKTRRYRLGEEFTAAGKVYRSLSQLREKKVPDVCHWYEDIYGREVFFVSNRKYFAMDVFDLMYDDRSTLWYFIREGEKLTRIYHDHGSPNIYVTEDVAGVEYNIWLEMRNSGYFE